MTVSSCIVLPTIDLEPFLKDPSSPESIAECQKAAESMKTFSAFAVRDPRVTLQDNETFLDMLEDYFDQPYDVKLKDARPEVHYQVGATPDGTEVPRCGRDDECLELVKSMKEEDKPLSFDSADNKWRFFWRIGQRPPKTNYPQLNAPQVLPEAFPEWETKMNKWGGLMMDAVSIVAQMVAVGLGLEKETFINKTKYGPHLLAPTGSDLVKYGELGTVLAGFHTDLNFLTIHGRSRFPGLHIWTPQNKKLLASIPQGCLLVQAGKQMEWLTSGIIQAGFHEVAIVPETLKAIQVQKEKKRPLWRISSTLFYHITSDESLAPLFGENSKYPPMPAGEQVQRELGFISLAK